MYEDDGEAHGGESDSSGGRNLDPPPAVEEPKQKAKDIDMQPVENPEARTTRRTFDGAQQMQAKATLILEEKPTQTRRTRGMP